MSRELAADWLRALRRAIQDVCGEVPGAPQRVRGLGITAVAPCLAVVGGETGVPGPLVQYDEPTETGENEWKTPLAVDLSAGATPLRSYEQAWIQTAHGWLVQQLTGRLGMDAHTIYELGWTPGEAVGHACVPVAIGAPWEWAGGMDHHARRSLGLAGPVKVVHGASDSFGLAAGAHIGAGEHLLYLGTFFTIMEAVADFSTLGPHLLGRHPFRWHISLPVGAALERTAGHLFIEEENPTRRIVAALRAALEALDRPDRAGRAGFRRWRGGVPPGRLVRYELPAIRDCGAVCAAPIASFAAALREHCRRFKVERLRVAGGYATSAELLLFLSRAADVELTEVPAQNGADGAMRFAYTALQGASA